MSLLLLTRKRSVSEPATPLTQALADSNVANWADSAISLALGINLTQEFADNLNNFGDSLGLSHFIASNLVGFWKLDEGSGQTFNDSSGNSNHGELGATSGSEASDPTWVSSGLSFDGGDHGRIPFILNPSVTDLTLFVAFLVNTGAAQIHLFSQQDGSGTGRPWLLLETTDVISSVLGGTSPAHTHSTVMSDESNHVGVIRKSGTTMSLFLDGGTKVDVTKTAESATGQYILGAAKSVAGGFHDRNIYLVMLYNTALSDADIAANHAAIKNYLLSAKGITVP